MRIFVVGATGAIGPPIVSLLVARGHTVIGTTRTPGKVDRLRATGAAAVTLDVLDRDGVLEALDRTKPDVVVHEATALAGFNDFRKFDEGFAPTNRLRSEGTDNLLEGIRRLPVRRLVAQSYAGPGAFAKTGGWIKTEEDPLDPNPPPAMRRGIEAMAHLERVVLGANGIEGTVLRYGGFYGPGSGVSDGGSQLEAVQRRRFPIVGAGTGVWSLIHTHDAAAATVAAIERRATGVFNVVDDDPAPVAVWLPALAEAIGAKPPRRVPAWLGRLLAGELAVVMMTESRGASNAKAKRILGWRPRYPSWKVGFRSGLGSADQAAAA
jgi:nucleoside-diphosphate-sugar epimerase